MICCCQVTNIFCARYDSINASSARSPCNFGPLTDLAITVFREMNINTVITRYQSVSLYAQERFHPQRFSLNSCSHSGISEKDGSPRSCA